MAVGRKIALGMWVTAVCALLGAIWLVISPGYRLSKPTPFGETITVDVQDGDRAVYFQPNTGWSEVDCTGSQPDGQPLVVRPDMTQQDLIWPDRWGARGTIGFDSAGEATLRCDGPEAGVFTLGPPITIVEIAGVVGLLILSLVLVGAGAVLWWLTRNRTLR